MGVKEIRLNDGRVALLDDADFERLKGFKWFAFKTGPPKARRVVAARNAPTGASSGRRWRNQLMHHDILPFPWFGFTVDHADGNPLNNQRENLRYATPVQQSWNSRRKPSRVSASKHTGVSFDRPRQIWRAEIYVEKLRIHLGYFKDEVDAARAWNAAAAEHRGEFAKLNKV